MTNAINTTPADRTVASDLRSPAFQGDTDALLSPLSDKETAPESTELNIIFIGKTESRDENDKAVTIDAEPPKKIRDGFDTIILPDANEQIAGFYHEKATQIIKAFPRLWKTFKGKRS